MNDPNALWKDLVPNQLNLMLNSNQGVASFRQKFEQTTEIFQTFD